MRAPTVYKYIAKYLCKCKYESNTRTFSLPVQVQTNEVLYEYIVLTKTLLQTRTRYNNEGTAILLNVYHACFRVVHFKQN